MSQVVSRLVDAARRGDPMAIGQLLSQRLRSRGIQVRILLQQSYLQIRLDSPRALPQQAITDWTKRWIVALHSDAIKRVRIYAWQPNQYFPDWMARFEVTREADSGMTVPNVVVPTDKVFEQLAGNPDGLNRKNGQGGHSPESVTPQPSADGTGTLETSSTLDLAAIPEQDRLAYYGALYAIANADGHIDPREVAIIEEIVNLQGLSEKAKAQVLNYRERPPALGDCLAVLAEADESLRIGLMMNLIDTSWANEELDPLEMAALKLAQRR